jgi:sugar diacid utilization regulator
VAVLSEGYESGQRRAVRREESVRREFVDDLLSGGSDPDGLAARAARFGFNIAGAHVVLVAGTRRVLEDAGPVHGRIEALVLAASGGRDILVATKNGMLVCMFVPDSDLIDAVVHMLDDSVEGPWHIGVGGTHGGPGGLLRSYREALNAIELAGRARLSDRVAYFERLLPQRLLASDPGVCGALASITLGPLERARGGGEPLIETLVAYFATGGNVESAARRLHLSPRAVRYRLDRIASLTGRSVFEPDDRFVLELALRCRAFVGDTPGGFQPGT